jgi:fructokinase
MAEFNVFGIGELLWDDLPEGRRAGGAPANFAYVAAQLGDHGSVLSRVGSDADGDELVDEMARRSVDVSFIQRDRSLPTGSVKITFVDGEPAYDIRTEVAWDELSMTDEWLQAASAADAIAFGTLGQRSEASRQTIRGLLSAAGEKAIKFLDLNLRQDFFTDNLIEESFGLASAAKLNADELERVCAALGIEKPDLGERLNTLRERFALDVICLTQGSANSLILTRTEMSDQEIPQIDLADAVGAGDAFSAGLVHGLLRGWDIARVNRFAASVGSFVASRIGAMPDFSDFG